MTDKVSDKIGKLKCPFCGAELLPHNEIENTEPIGARCGKPGCPWFMWNFPWEIWQALIDGKKAQDGLKVATDFIGFVNTSRHADGALAAMAIGKLNEITSITKQE